MVHTHRKEGLSVRADQPPMVLSLSKRKESLGLDLSCFDSSGRGAQAQWRKRQSRAQGQAALQKSSSTYFVHGFGYWVDQVFAQN